MQLVDTTVESYRPAADACRRLGRALAWSAVYGAAIGARHGWVSAVVHALGVPAAFVAVAGFAAPAFYIALSHLGTPLDPRALAHATLDGVEDATRLLAGLAPVALLLTTTAESHAGAAAAAALGLGIALCLGLRTQRSSLTSRIGSPSWRARLAGWAYVGFSLLLAGRVWWVVLPALGRGAG